MTLILLTLTAFCQPAECFFMTQLYFLAIVLPYSLNEEIKRFKTHMLEQWGCRVAMKSPAHITLLPPYWMDTDLESSLQDSVSRISRPFSPFTLQLQNFSAFKPRTLFVAVQPSEQLYRMKQAIDDFFTAHPLFQAKPDRRSFHPHITIATRDLHKRSFAEAWSFYETKPFERSFTAEGLCVLRHNSRDWDVIHTAPFGSE